MAAPFRNAFFPIVKSATHAVAKSTLVTIDVSTPPVVVALGTSNQSQTAKHERSGWNAAKKFALAAIRRRTTHTTAYSSNKGEPPSATKLSTPVPGNFTVSTATSPNNANHSPS